MRLATLLVGILLASSSMLNAQQQPASTATPAVRITHGPTVEFASSDRAIIAWSTNVSSGTVVHYGIDPNNLSEQVMAPWGSLTHRVTLHKLQPNTRYYFKVVSGQAAGTGTQVQSPVDQFETKPSK